VFFAVFTADFEVLPAAVALLAGLDVLAGLTGFLAAGLAIAAAFFVLGSLFAPVTRVAFFGAAAAFAT
jgi:hypothetical protein